MSAPALYRDTDGGIKRFDATRETVIDCQGIAALTDASAVSLFDDATGNITLGAAVTGNITIGNTGDNHIVIDNGVPNEVRIEGNLRVNGTETVSDTVTFNGNTIIGSDSVDTLDVNATSNFDADVTFGESTTGGETFTFLGNVTTKSSIVLTNTEIGSSLPFDGNAGYTISNDSNALTLQTTTSGNVAIDAAGDAVVGADGNVTIDAGATGTVAIRANSLYGVYVAATGDVVVGDSTALPAGNTAQLTVTEATADTPVLTLKAGAVTETSILTGSTDPTTGIAAPTGSLYMLNTGSLYVKTGALDANWSEIGTTAGSTLQAAYTASSPATITMGTSKPLTFITNETGGSESDFLVEQSGGADYLLCDASADEIVIGSSAVGVRVLNDVLMAGTTPQISADSTNLTITTTTSGDVVLTAAAGNVAITGTDNDVSVTTGTGAGDAFYVNTNALYVDGENNYVGINTSTFTEGAPLTITGALDGDIIALDGGGARSTIMRGTTLPNDGAGTAADVGSLFIYSTITPSASVWLKNTGAATGWVQLATTGAISLQTAYENMLGTAVNLNGTGQNWILKTDAGPTYNWSIQDSGGNNFFTTNNAATPTADLGSASIDVRVVGEVASNVTFDSTADAARTIALGGAGALTINQSGTGNLVLDSVGGTSSLSSATGTTVSADANGVTVNGAGGVLIQPSTGTVRINPQASGVTIDPDAGAILVETTAANLTLQTTGASGNVVLQASGTGGTTIIDSVGGTYIRSDASVYLQPQVANEDILMTVTGATGEISFTAHAATLTYNDATEASLDTTSGVFTGVTSIVGALNALDGALSTGDVIVTYTTAEAVTAGDLLYLTTTGTVGKADADDAAKRRPIGFAYESKGSAVPCKVQLAGETVLNSAITAGDEGKYIYMDKTTTGAVLVDISAYTTGDTALRVGVVSASGLAGTAKAVISFGEPTLL